ncbi:hypothetical protein HPP92_023700 [Vanilla planifolia]|uniref:Uncharacterized protein n=1 Tax=Vanilla planifolia TaxID=51239 RepID=A0A835UEQ0_VANPL|nr:hypothetical protein HPP92_023700 [Vanilla planifolia]
MKDSCLSKPILQGRTEYFKTKPFACDPSSLPKYPPTKEIDARSREDAHRRRIPKVAGRARAVEVARRPLRVHRDPQDSSGSSRLSNNTETESNMNNNATDSSNEKLACPIVTGDTRFFVDLQPVAALKPPYQVRHVKHISQGDIPFSGPLHVNPSSGFAWVKKPQEDRPLVKAHHKYSSRNSGCVGREPPTAIRAKVTSDIDNIAEVPAAEVALELPEGIEQHRIMKTAMLKNWAQLECPHSFDSTSTFHSQCFTREYHDEGERVEFSGPLLNKSHKVDELLKKHERQIRQAVRRSWFQRVAGRKVK